MSMACLDISMDPRISFSNDFVDTQQAVKQENNSYREAPVSSDFEFSVRNFNLIPADEIFFKGVLLPSKDDDSSTRKMTLREELLVNDDNKYENASLPRIPKSSGWWKERLGLKKAHVMSRKGDSRNDGVLGDIVEEKKGSVFVVHQEEEPVAKTIQELLFNCGDAAGIRDSNQDLLKENLW